MSIAAFRFPASPLAPAWAGRYIQPCDTIWLSVQVADYRLRDVKGYARRQLGIVRRP